MKIALLGNVTLDFLAQDFRRAGHDVYVPPGFDAWRQEVLDPASGLHVFAPDAVLLVMEGGVSLEDERIIGTFVDAQERVPPRQADAQERVPPVRVVVPDIAALAAETPGFWDVRMRTLAAMPFSLAGLKAIEDEFYFALEAGGPRSCAAAAKKILAVDADNTLWNGIVSEDGADAVTPYVDFQKGLLALKARGVLLVLLSKNDPVGEGRAPARPPLAAALARADMPITLDDFSAVRVNWSPKPGNLLTVCRELNLGTDSVVFVDDNPHERAQMKAHLPEVAVPPFPADLANPAQFLRRLERYFFASAGTTAEDRARAEMYRAEAAEDVPRLAQMAGTTNQFNATTIRRTAEEMAALVADPAHRVWTFRAGDAFGEMGLVCYVVYDCATARISDFVMSCRAMGRTLEHFAVNHVRRELAAEGLALAGIDCVPTAKNGPFREFLATLDLSRDAVTWYGER